MSVVSKINLSEKASKAGAVVGKKAKSAAGKVKSFGIKMKNKVTSDEFKASVAAKKTTVATKLKAAGKKIGKFFKTVYEKAKEYGKKAYNVIKNKFQNLKNSKAAKTAQETVQQTTQSVPVA